MSEGTSRTPLPFWRCCFSLRQNSTSQIIFQQEFGMIGKEGLPPTLQQVRRYVTHNLRLLKERNHPDARFWEMWLNTLNHSIQQSSEVFDSPSGVISEQGIDGFVFVDGLLNLGEVIGHIETSPSVLIDSQELDDYLMANGH